MTEIKTTITINGQLYSSTFKITPEANKFTKKEVVDLAIESLLNRMTKENVFKIETINKEK